MTTNTTNTTTVMEFVQSVNGTINNTVQPRWYFFIMIIEPGTFTHNICVHILAGSVLQHEQHLGITLEPPLDMPVGDWLQDWIPWAYNRFDPATARPVWNYWLDRLWATADQNNDHSLIDVRPINPF